MVFKEIFKRFSHWIFIYFFFPFSFLFSIKTSDNTSHVFHNIYIYFFFDFLRIKYVYIIIIRRLFIKKFSLIYIYVNETQKRIGEPFARTCALFAKRKKKVKIKQKRRKKNKERKKSIRTNINFNFISRWKISRWFRFRIFYIIHDKKRYRMLVLWLIIEALKSRNILRNIHSIDTAVTNEITKIANLCANRLNRRTTYHTSLSSC